MRIATIRYMRRKNRGNYEHEELTAEAVIGEEENEGQALAELVHFVQMGLGIVPPKDQTAPAKPKAEQLNDDIFGPKEAEELFNEWIRLADALKLGPKAQTKFFERHGTEVSRMATEEPDLLRGIIEQMTAKVGEQRQQQEVTK